MQKPAFLFAATLALSACATAGGNAPSLAKRGYELSDSDIQRLLEGEVGVIDPAPPQAIALPPAEEAKAAAAYADHLRGQAAFQERVARTEQRVNAARGTAPESEAWIEAQMAVSRLDSARAPSVGALGALDSLYLDVIDSLGLEQALSIQPRRDKVAEDVAYQSRVVAALSGVLR